jgi:hypothetical protein
MADSTGFVAGIPPRNSHGARRVEEPCLFLLDYAPALGFGTPLDLLEIARPGHTDVSPGSDNLSPSLVR